MPEPLFRTGQTPKGEKIVHLHCSLCEGQVMLMQKFHSLIKGRSYYCHDCNPEMQGHYDIYGKRKPKGEDGSLPI